MIILFLFLGLVSGGLTVMLLQRPKEVKSPALSKFIDPKLSWPAKQILKEYNALPVENRPFDNITNILIALDVKHGGIGTVNAHYSNYRDSYGWDKCDGCRYPDLYGKCTKFKGYDNLRDTIRDVSNALDAQKQALEVAKVQPDLDDIKTLMERMRQEKEIITSVTKELM